MIWIARPINSEVGSLLKFGLSVYAFYSLGLPALALWFLWLALFFLLLPDEQRHAASVVLGCIAHMIGAFAYGPLLLAWFRLRQAAQRFA